MLTSVAAFLWIRGTQTTVAFDHGVVAWNISAIILHVYVGSVWPGGHAEMRLTASMAVLMCYCILPLPLRGQMTIGLLHTAGSILVSAGLNPSLKHASFWWDLCWLTVVNVLGMAMSRQTQVRRRWLFVSLLRQSELSASLGKALAEVRTLRGLIRVCAWCKKVDSEGVWQQLESYVRDHSHAEFTHGICPACLESATNDADPQLLTT